MQLSTGPWSYNRFEQFENSLTEGSKPDFLDKDGDGDKKGSFKKAVKDQKEDEGTCSKCGGDHDDDKHDKKDKKDDKKKPAFLQKEGYAEAIAKSTAKAGKGIVDTAGKAAGAVNKAINTATGRKDVKEAIVANLMANGLANNPVSAEVIAEHMSDEWAQAIIDDLG